MHENDINAVEDSDSDGPCSDDVTMRITAATPTEFVPTSTADVDECVFDPIFSEAWVKGWKPVARSRGSAVGDTA